MTLLGRKQKGTYTYFSFCVSNLKMWTVSVLLEAERYRPSILNANEQILTHLEEQRKGKQVNNTHTNACTESHLIHDLI